MDDALPIIDGLTETAQDAEPLFLTVTKLLADSRRTATDDVRIGLDAIERAYDKESDPEVRARYGRIIADLQGSKSSGAGQDSLGARRVRSTR